MDADQTNENISFVEAKAKETLYPGSLWWNVNNYSFLSKQTDEFIESPQFTTGPNKEAIWCVKFFPGGTTANPGCYASLSLVICSFAEHTVIAKFRLRCCDVAGYDIVFPVQTEYRLFSTRYDQLMLLETKGITFDEGLQRRSVPLMRDQIDIICDIVILKPEFVNQVMKIWAPREYLSDDLEMLLLSGKHADTIICANGSTLTAHRAVLAARSSKFPDFFDETQDRYRIQLDDSLDHNVIREFVHFLYAGIFPGIQDMPIELLIAACKYRVKDLKTVCEEYLTTTNHFFTVERATGLLAITFEYDISQKLRDRIFRFVREHIREIQETTQWDLMLKKFPDQASQLITYSINM